uniref:Uncharacterized protein n=1 Tax=Anguilla anguilla TaxID=7936 RepID=A0A0E9RIU5_ANGAN
MLTQKYQTDLKPALYSTKVHVSNGTAYEHKNE